MEIVKIVLMCYTSPDQALNLENNVNYQTHLVHVECI